MTFTADEVVKVAAMKQKPGRQNPPNHSRCNMLAFADGRSWARLARRSRCRVKSELALKGICLYVRAPLCPPTRRMKRSEASIARGRRLPFVQVVHAASAKAGSALNLRFGAIVTAGGFIVPAAALILP